MRIMLLGGWKLIGNMGSSYRGFIKQGHAVSFIPTRTRLKLADSNGGKQDIYREIVRDIKLFKPNVIIHCQPWNPPVEVIAEFKKIAPTIYWTVDDPHSFITKRHNNIWENYDGILSCCKESVSNYKENGIPALLFYPPIVDPVIIYPKKPVKEFSYDTCFTFAQLYIKEFWGKNSEESSIHQETPDFWFTEYVSRDLLIKTAIKYGSVVSVGLRGRFYKTVEEWHGLTIFKAKTKKELPIIFSSCKINVNSHAWPTYSSLNERTFSILASKGFQLCDKVKGIEEIFTPDKHLVTYNNLEEFKDKLKYYLEHDTERKTIAEQGYEFVLENYRNDIVCGKVVDWIKETFE